MASSLNDLNDKAILKLMEQLSLDDLCTMRGVCKRFRHLAKKTFRCHHAKQMEFDDLLLNWQTISRVIQHFGPMIESITINGSIAFELNTSVLQMLRKYCTYKLKQIRLNCIYFDKPTATAMKELAETLETIELFYCKTDSKLVGANYGTMFRNADSLKELVIVGNNDEIDLKFLNKKWTSIEKLEIVSPQLADENVLSLFLKKNPTVRCIGYLPRDPIKNAQSWLQALTSTPDVEELSIELNTKINIASTLSKLKKLRRIAINCRGYNKSIHDVITALTKIATLEVLTLRNVEFRELVTLPKLPNIKTLELREVKSLFDRQVLVSELAKQWNHVENLCLDHSVVSSANDIEIFVENLPQLKNLFLCNMKSFYIMPNAMLYLSWCQQRINQLHIFLDARFLAECGIIDRSQKIVFQPMKNHIAQNIHVLCNSNL